MKKLKLGEKIKVNHRLVRRKVDWHYNWTIEMFPKPKEVTVVGVRILWDGYLERDGQFIMTKSKRVFLVAENLKSTFYVSI